MGDGIATLDRWIDRLRELQSLTRRAAPEVARVVDRELRDQIARGQDPDGKPWPRTQDGKRPLRDAGEALTVRAAGSVVVAKLTGAIARHHSGRVRGGVRRQVLPGGGALPARFARAVRDAVTREFRDLMRGGA